MTAARSRLPAPFLGFLTVIVAACQPPAPATRCQSDQNCPVGYACSAVTRFCVSLGQDAGSGDRALDDATARDAAIDAAADAGDGTRCGTIQSYQVIDDDEFLWYRYAASGTTVGTEGGVLTITYPAVTGDVGIWSGLIGAGSGSLRDRTLRVRLTNAIDPANTDLDTSLYYMADNDNFVGLAARSDTLLAIGVENGVSLNLTSTSFDPTLHLWWQLRHHGNRLFFETSPDAVSWTRFHDIPTPAFIDDGQPRLGSGTTQGAVAVADSISYDSLNAGLAPDPWCPASSRKDGFEGDSLGAAWFHGDYADCQVAVSGGALHLRGRAVHSEACHVESAAPYVLTDSSVSVRVLATPSATGLLTVLALRSAGSTWVEFGLAEGTLFAYSECHGANIDSWDDAAPLAGRTMLQVSQSGGDIIFSVRASQAEDWAEVHRFACSDPLDLVFVDLMLSFWQPGVSAGNWFDASFDDYNR